MVTVEPSAHAFTRQRLQSTAAALVTLAGFLAAMLYVSSRAPGPTHAPATTLQASSPAEVAGLTGALAADWGRARHADLMWIDLCYEQRTSLPSCAGALRKQIAALQPLLLDIGAQHLGGSRLAAVVDTRFLPSIAAALKAKRVALSDLEQGDIGQFRQADRDPAICIQPVSAAIVRAAGANAGSQYLSYPNSPRESC